MKVYKDKEFKEIRPVLVYTVCDFCGKEFKKIGNIKRLVMIDPNQKQDNDMYGSMCSDFDGWSFDVCSECLSKHEKKEVRIYAH